MSSGTPSFLRPSQTAPRPSFLAPGRVDPGEFKRAEKELMFDRFELAFPRLIDRLYGGETINAVLRDFPIPVERGAFVRWIKKDAQRFATYLEAKEVRTEIWTGEMMDIAKGEPDSNGELIDLDRTKILLDTYKWLVQSENKKGYGKSTQIEMTGNISITAALGAAATRVEQLVRWTDDDEPEPTMKQLAEPIEAEWEDDD